jgi:hypothetical protein
MRSFREATRAFWSGWAEIPAYLLAVKDHGWEVLWGAGAIGVVFGIATLYWSPSWHAFGYVLALLVFVAGYQLWRDLHLRLRSRLQVSRIIAQTWRTEGMVYDRSPMPPRPSQGRGVSREGIAYYFEVEGTSEASTIRDVRVQLAEINPPVQNLDWLPVLLFHKHDHPPHAEKFDLHPGDVKHIDLVSAYRGDDHFEIRHIVDGVNRNVPASGHHRLTVTITAGDTPKLSVSFDVFMDSNGVLQCNKV